MLDVTNPGCKAARDSQIAKREAHEARKALEIAAIKAQLANRLERFLTA